jgi:hypothetical protein
MLAVDLFLALVAESDQRFSGIIMAREVMSLAPLDMKGQSGRLGVTKGAI